MEVEKAFKVLTAQEEVELGKAITLRRNQIADGTLVQGSDIDIQGVRAATTLAYKYSRFAQKLVNGFLHGCDYLTPEDKQDILQEAFLATYRSALQYNPYASTTDKPARFAFYVQSSITECVRKNMLRLQTPLSSTVPELKNASAWRATQESLHETMGRMPTDEEISHILNVEKPELVPMRTQVGEVFEDSATVATLFESNDTQWAETFLSVLQEFYNDDFVTLVRAAVFADDYNLGFRESLKNETPFLPSDEPTAYLVLRAVLSHPSMLKQVLSRLDDFGFFGEENIEI